MRCGGVCVPEVEEVGLGIGVFAEREGRGEGERRIRTYMDPEMDK